MGFDTGYNYIVEKEIINHSDVSSVIKEKTIECVYKVESIEGIIIILEQRSTYKINGSQSMLLSSDDVQTVFIKEGYSLEEIDKNLINNEEKIINFRKFMVRKDNIIHRFEVFHSYGLNGNLLAGVTE